MAVKTVLSGDHASAEQRIRLLGEAEAVAKLQHPNIVQLFQVDRQEGRPYFVMEYIDGGTLADKLQCGDRPSPREAAAMVETLARAVEFAHQRGIIHRDLKPANVLLTADGTPKVTDFGLAKHLEANASMTQTGVVIGTPSYMAPEQAAAKSGEIGLRTDVYALGAILYELLAGQPPFHGESMWETQEEVRNR